MLGISGTNYWPCTATYIFWYFIDMNSSFFLEQEFLQMGSKGLRNLQSIHWNNELGAKEGQKNNSVCSPIYLVFTDFTYQEIYHTALWFSLLISITKVSSLLSLFPQFNLQIYVWYFSNCRSWCIDVCPKPQNNSGINYHQHQPTIKINRCGPRWQQSCCKLDFTKK